jgi:protein phosphatase
MDSSPATLYCPNCFAPNLETEAVCLQCNTWLPKRYLWVVGEFRADDLQLILGDRFLVRGSKVVLDAQPGLLLRSPTGLPDAALPYLRLFAYRLHLPQLFAIVSSEITANLSEQAEPFLLLEQAPLGSGDLKGQYFDPQITAAAGSVGTAVPLLQVWGKANPLRQINWLWQMANLWQPFSLERVATSLLQPHLLRVEGPILRLLEVTLDESADLIGLAEPGIDSLGQLWLQWVPEVEQALASPLEELCQRMISGSIQSAEAVIQQLDQWLNLLAAGKLALPAPLSYRFSSVTYTDQGPNRKRNEDACFPASGTHMTNAAQSITVICDGVGGHDGGDVASGLAIATLESYLAPLPKNLTHNQIISTLETAILTANTLIFQRNENEHRQERQRMGTTLVTGLTNNHQMYLAHVGDSRAYLITRYGCYQVTLDDDVASREVRLGYALYRDVAEHPIAGSLIQALGMVDSGGLYPNIQRLILDQDCLFLLCSDGLSDYDRVEELWQAELLPVLEGTVALSAAGRRLIELANLKNGHDNVTIGLVHCRLVGEPEEAVVSSSEIPLTQPQVAVHPLAEPEPEAPAAIQSPTLKVVPDPMSDPISDMTAKRSPTVSRPFFLLALLGLLGTAIYLLLSLNRSSEIPPEPIASPVPALESNPSLATSAPLKPVPLEIGNFLQVKAEQIGQLSDRPSLTATPNQIIVSGGILQVQTVQTSASPAETWVQFQVCSTASNSDAIALQPPLNKSIALASGQSGWANAKQVSTFAVPIKNLNPEQRGACADP